MAAATGEPPIYPWSGQEECFDSAGGAVPCAGTGQDGEYRPGRPWPAPRFGMVDDALALDRLVLDRLIGLTWPRDASAAPWPMTLAEALAWVAERNAQSWLGHADWRLPTRRELLALVSLAHARPALPPGHPFTGIFQHWHWTSTPAANAPGHFWRVHLEGGRMFPGPGDARHMVLPVRGRGWLPPETPELAAAAGRPWPEPRFETAGEGVLDRLTGLVWRGAAQPENGEAAWAEALEAARETPGWRMPSIWELESLVDASRAWAALPPGHPLGQGLDGVWSSTSSGYDPAWAWVLYFGKGAVGVGHKPGRHFKFLLTAEG
ncbi:DUF1566 domain-containing protein [Fundidesulfovibrio agrisoli]|uniref:Lcl C-terminal domain-containing protein n=1 Tax=Fundidesulfovibrio agrisoli TaxID=2922717 RepID=UPI001FAC514C|nr:DUF1566 domain-containing protein [Fundidesulfovibrio agrisoli]